MLHHLRRSLRVPLILAIGITAFQMVSQDKVSLEYAATGFAANFLVFYTVALVTHLVFTRRRAPPSSR